MTLDLANPEHRDALAWACSLTPENLAVMTDRARHGWAISEPTHSREQAALALSSPTESAALVRALLEGCGVTACDQRSGQPPSDRTARVWIWWMPHDEDGAAYLMVSVEGFGSMRYVNMRDIPALILRLLACTTKEEALAALREHGR